MKRKVHETDRGKKEGRKRNTPKQRQRGQWVFSSTAEKIQTNRFNTAEWMKKTLLSIEEKWAVRNDKLSGTSAISTALREGWWEEEEGNRVKRESVWFFFFRIHHCWQNVKFPLDSTIVNETMMISCWRRKQRSSFYRHEAGGRKRKNGKCL